MLVDRAQKTLFPEPIKSIGFDQIDILQDIMTLYCPQGFECDPTYSVGNFYKKHIPQPKYKFDIDPQVPGVIYASADNLPLENESVASINFDPPFLASKGPSHEEVKEGQNIITNRFGLYESLETLLEFYHKAFIEFNRVLKPRGWLVFKCQDLCYNHKNFYTHIVVFEQGIKTGFSAIDMFILLAKQRVISGRHKRQEHARKYHSYFWVFQKQSLKK